MIGLGAVGSAASDFCARWGVASLLLVDRGRFKAESILTHPVHPADIGRSKARVAGERAKAISPDSLVRVHEGPVEDLAFDVLFGLDALLLASDNLACELEVSRRCAQLGLRLLQASVHGPSLVAQVRSLANRPGADGPCLACDYQAADWQAYDRGTLFSCAGPEDSNATRPDGPATRSAPELCTQAACLAVTELAGLLQGRHAAGENRLVEACGFHHGTTVAPLVRRAHCPESHRALERVPLERPLIEATPRQLFEAVGAQVAQAPGMPSLLSLSLSVEGERFARLGACACPEHPELGRFLPVAGPAGTCDGCGLELEAHPVYTHEEVPAAALVAHLDRSLGSLGARVDGCLRVARAERSFLFHDSFVAESHPKEARA